MKPGARWSIAALAVLAATTADARRHGPPRRHSMPRPRPAVMVTAEAPRPALTRRSGFATTSDGVRLYYEVSGTGHSPYFEKPEAWNAAVRRFLVESRAGPSQSSR